MLESFDMKRQPSAWFTSVIITRCKAKTDEIDDRIVHSFFVLGTGFRAALCSVYLSGGQRCALRAAEAK